MKYCTKCGKELDSNTKFCPNCGTPTEEPTFRTTANNSKPTNPQKSKIAAGILGIFLGSFGIHNFYLGYTSKAVAQLLLTLVGWILCGMGPVVASIWGFIEGILILVGSINQDADGNYLSD